MSDETKKPLEDEAVTDTTVKADAKSDAEIEVKTEAAPSKMDDIHPAARPFLFLDFRHLPSAETSAAY